MAISMRYNWTAALLRNAVIPPDLADLIDKAVARGVPLDRFPKPPQMGEAQLLFVNDLVERNVPGIPAHWNLTDCICAVYPPDHGSLTLNVQADDTIATSVALNGKNIRTLKKETLGLKFRPRQSFFIGSFEIMGYLLETSDGVIQWMILPPEASEYAIGDNDENSTGPADGFSLTFYVTSQPQKMMSLGHMYSPARSKGLGFGEMATAPRALASMMPEAASVMSLEIMHVGAGGMVAGTYPDDPTSKKKDWKAESVFPFWFRLVSLDVYNRFADAIKAKVIDQNALNAAMTVQQSFVRELSKQLSIGQDTGTHASKMKRVSKKVKLDGKAKTKKEEVSETEEE